MYTYSKIHTLHTSARTYPTSNDELHERREWWTCCTTLTCSSIARHPCNRLVRNAFIMHYQIKKKDNQLPFFNELLVFDWVVGIVLDAKGCRQP